MNTPWHRWVALACALFALAAGPAWAGTIVAQSSTAVPRPSLAVRVQPDAGEIGQPLNFYVGALFQGLIFIKSADAGWRVWTPGMPIPAFQSATGAASHTINVLDGSLDVSAYAGAKVYVGYGRTEAEMLSTPDHLQRVYTVYNPGTSIGRYRLNARGVFAIFDRRGWPNGYYSGDMIRMFHQFDQDLQNTLNVNSPGAQASPTVGAEVALQLDILRSWGVNSITLELRTTDSAYMPNAQGPPACNVPPSVGFLWPQPTATELANLAAFFDLAQGKGMRVQLMLNNTHMEENPRGNAQAWLAAILNVVKAHPALDVVAFGGNTHMIDTNGDGVPDACGGRAAAVAWPGIGARPVRAVGHPVRHGAGRAGAQAFGRGDRGRPLRRQPAVRGAGCGRGAPLERHHGDEGHLRQPRRAR